MERPRRSVRLTLAALVVPLGLGLGACGNLADSPATTTVPPPDPSVMVIEGRPLRRRNGRLHRARARLGHSHLTDRQALWLSADVRAALAEHWRTQGELEHASVVAFQDLARRLAMVDAPEHLVRGALRAAEQEADHWYRCFELAGRYLGQSLRPGRLRRPLRLPRSRTTELSALAVEALRDGVLNEGYAALLAEAKAARASDARVHETLRVIAHDEAEHAALSAEVLAWCLTVGGPATREAVADALLALPTRMSGAVLPHGVPSRPLADHGLADVDPDGARYDDLLASIRFDVCSLLAADRLDAAA
jgi:hypothetical protein